MSGLRGATFGVRGGGAASSVSPEVPCPLCTPRPGAGDGWGRRPERQEGAGSWSDPAARPEWSGGPCSTGEVPVEGVRPARLPFAGWPPASSSPGSRALYPRHPLRPLRPTLVAGPLLPPPHFGARTPVPTPSPRTSRSPCHGPTSWRVSPIGERGLGGDGQGTGVRTPKTYCSPHTPAWGPPPVEWGVWAPGPAAPIPGSAAIAPGPRGERSSRVPTV